MFTFGGGDGEGGFSVAFFLPLDLAGAFFLGGAAFFGVGLAAAGFTERRRT